MRETLADVAVPVAGGPMYAPNPDRLRVYWQAVGFQLEKEVNDGPH